MRSCPLYDIIKRRRQRGWWKCGGGQIVCEHVCVGVGGRTDDHAHTCVSLYTHSPRPQQRCSTQDHFHCVEKYVGLFLFHKLHKDKENVAHKKEAKMGSSSFKAYVRSVEQM